MHVLKIFLLSVLCGVIAGCATTRENEGAGAKKAQHILAETLERDGGSGIAAAIVKDGRVIWSGAAGFADLENKRLLTPDTPMRIGSVSKPLTATLLLRYAADNGIVLDTELKSLTGEGLGIPDRLTLTHLATHTSGVRHYDFANFEEANNLYYKASLSEAVTPILSEQLLFAPGEKFVYSSHGYNVIGAALEEMSGRSFAALLEAFIVQPLALESTSVDHPFNLIAGRSGQYTVTVSNPAFPWMEDGATINTFYRDGSDYYPSGGILSSAVDLAQFTAAVFDTAFLDDDGQLRTREPVLLASGMQSGFSENHLYSFGWEIRLDESGHITSYGHNGETNGAYAVIRYFPEYGVSVAGVANYNLMGREPAFFEAIGDDLWKAFAQEND